jgi:hypothetical protein
MTDLTRLNILKKIIEANRIHRSSVKKTIHRSTTEEHILSNLKTWYCYIFTRLFEAKT